MEGGSIAPASLPSPPPAAAVNMFPSSSSSADGAGTSSLYIVLILVAFAVVATLLIRCLMTCHCEVICCGWEWRHPSAAVADVPLTPVDGGSASNSSKGDAAVTSEKEKTASTAGPQSSFSLPKLLPECAVCLSPLQQGDELRLLPACGHAFHAPCVDTWLRTTPSCPLCRTSVTLPVPPTSFLRAPPGSGRWRRASGSFRIESGTANRRPNPTGETRPRPNPAPVSQPSVPPVMRTYSIGLTEDEVEAVIAQIGRRTTEKKDKPSEAILTVPPNEGASGGGESSSGRSGRWLWNYIDRFASSASSSMRFSGRWSRRYDGGDGQQRWWDLEGSSRREEEDGITYSFYRWLMGE